MIIRDHLESRHCNLDYYNVTVDEEEGLATFLLSDSGFSVSGYQQYRPSADKKKKNHPREGRYFTYRTKGKFPVFGMESWYWTNHLFIIEGIFDCVRLHNLGHSAIATLSNDPKELRNWVLMMNRPVYAICDPGSSGVKMAKYAHKHFTCIETDLGDMRQEDVEKVVETLLH